MIRNAIARRSTQVLFQGRRMFAVGPVISERRLKDNMGRPLIRGGVPLLQQAFHHGERPAVLDEHGMHSYRQLLTGALRVAEALRQALRCTVDLNGASIALLCPADSRYIGGQWGIWQAGGMCVPVGTQHPPAEVAHVLNDSGASCVLVAGREHHATVSAALGAKSSVCVLDLDEILAGLGDGMTSEAMGIEDEYGPASLARGAYLVYTSGTTGKPKGVYTTHKNLLAQIRSLNEAWEWQPEDRIQNVLPLHHVHGIMCVVGTSLWKGATLEMSGKKFEASEVWRRWERSMDGESKPLSLFMAVPTIYARLIAEYEKLPKSRQEAASEACRQFRLMVSGSMALPETVMRRWHDITGHVLLERYGMSEFGMALSNPLHGKRQPGRVGKPLPGIEIRLESSPETAAEAAQAAGSSVAAAAVAANQENRVGELLVRGDQVFARYWNRPEATADAFTSDRFFRTGDIAELSSDDGTVKILGRASVDILKSGGYKISALDIERVLLECPLVEEVAVVGRENDDLGQSIEAVVVPNASANRATLDDSLRTWCTERLARYKVPRVYHIWNEIPRNAMGKVNKKDLLKVL